MSGIRCPRCAGRGPWRFVKFIAGGAVFICDRIVDFMVCHGRVQVEDRDVAGML